MTQIIKLFLFSITLIISSCGIVHLNLNSSTNDSCNEKYDKCYECLIVPKSGTHRDLRQGYYFDPVERKCKFIQYSSGGISAPFKAMEECENCCCK